jgi:hypothetical protein
VRSRERMSAMSEDELLFRELLEEENEEEVNEEKNEEEVKRLKSERLRQQKATWIRNKRKNPEYKAAEQAAEHLRKQELQELQEAIKESKPESGPFTDGFFIPFPKKILDPTDPNLRLTINTDLYSEGYAVVGATDEGLRFMETKAVKNAVNKVPHDRMHINETTTDEYRRIEGVPSDWIERLLPWIRMWTNPDVRGRICAETTIMRISQGAIYQSLHMDSAVITEDIWNADRDGFGEKNKKAQYEHMPLEILVALTDDCVTRVCPKSQWVTFMTQEEYAAIEFFGRIPIRLKKGQALIFHPNLVHSGTIPYYKEFDVKIHSKIMAPLEDNDNWVPVEWQSNGTYPISRVLPTTRQDKFY